MVVPEVSPKGRVEEDEVHRRDSVWGLHGKGLPFVVNVTSNRGTFRGVEGGVLARVFYRSCPSIPT